MNKRDTHRLYLNKASTQYINQSVGNCRFMYNQLLAQLKTEYELHKDNPEVYKRPGLPLESISYRIKDIRNNPEFPWLLNTPAGCYLQVCDNLSKAFRNFFIKQSKGITGGFPKFKRKSYQGFITFQKIQYKVIDIDGRKYLQLEGLWKNKELHIRNLIRINNSKDIPENAKSITIKKTSTGKYHVSFLYEHEVTPAMGTKALAIDFGLKDLIIAYDGENTINISNPRHLKQKECRLKRYQRMMSKKKLGSNNYHKARIRVAKLHEKITNIRDHHIKYTISQLMKDVHSVILEDLSVKNMVKNHSLAKSIHDASWYKFKLAIMNYCQSNGADLYQANRFYPSTQICSDCGSRNATKVALGIEEWTCEACGCIHDRDGNAAMQYVPKEDIIAMQLKEAHNSNNPVTKIELINRLSALLDIKELPPNKDLVFTFDHKKLKRFYDLGFKIQE